MKKVLSIVFIVLYSVSSFAQTDELMIVEYVDWQGGAGVGLKIYNPTNQVKDLSNYYFTIYQDGSLTTTNQVQLSGTLNPQQYKIFANSDYQDECNTPVNVITIIGVNKMDVAAITLGPTNNIIDMVGAYGSTNKITIKGFSDSDATFENNLLRKSGNCIRYYDRAGTSIHSWPNSPTDSVINWTWQGENVCLSVGTVLFGIAPFSIGDDTLLCTEESLTLNMASLNALTYKWSDGTTGNTITLDSNNAGVISLEISYGNECISIDEMVLSFENCDTIIIPKDTIVPTPTPTPIGFLIPNIITPNNDKINDAFVVTGLKGKPIKLEIYNRWGKSIYKNDDYQNDWEAKSITDGMYYYRIEDALNTYKGWLNVLR